MVISNSGSAPRQLLKAQSPVAKTVELHTHVADHGVMKMRPVASIARFALSQEQAFGIAVGKGDDHPTII